jgi:ribonucleotide reductase beta subunit family protein with ferritin-like domain
MSASSLDYETVRAKHAEEMQAIATYNAEKEVLLVAREDRDNLLEQHYPYVLSLVDDHRNSHWVPNEVKLDDDLKQWAKLSPAIKTMVKRVLTFFLKADSIVLDNAAHFCDELQFFEFRTFLAVQEAAEAVHGQVYSNLLLAFVSDHRERAELIKDLKINPALLGKSNWANGWKNKDRTFQERVIGFSKVEGISFQAAFAVIYWLKERGLLPGLCATSRTTPPLGSCCPSPWRSSCRRSWCTP